MAAFISIISLIAVVLQIILFFKVWRMCNDVRAIREESKRPYTVNSIPDLLFMSRTNDPRFRDELLYAIYIELYDEAIKGHSLDYSTVFSSWEGICRYNNWQFPELLEGLDTRDKFLKVFEVRTTSLYVESDTAGFEK